MDYLRTVNSLVVSVYRISQHLWRSVDIRIHGNSDGTSFLTTVLVLFSEANRNHRDHEQ